METGLDVQAHRWPWPRRRRIIIASGAGGIAALVGALLVFTPMSHNYNFGVILYSSIEHPSAVGRATHSFAEGAEVRTSLEWQGDASGSLSVWINDSNGHAIAMVVGENGTLAEELPAFASSGGPVTYAAIESGCFIEGYGGYHISTPCGGVLDVGGTYDTPLIRP